MKKVTLLVSYDICEKDANTKDFKEFVQSIKNGEVKDNLQEPHMHNLKVEIKIK